MITLIVVHNQPNYCKMKLVGIEKHQIVFEFFAVAKNTDDISA